MRIIVDSLNKIFKAPCRDPGSPALLFSKSTCCPCKCPGCAGFCKDQEAFCASGALMGGECYPFAIDIPFAPCCCGASIFMDIKSGGQYCDAVSSFPNAIAGSFDSVALREGFIVCIYEKKALVGSPFVVAKGPIIINNSNWKNSFYDPLIKPFQNYRMTWSTENMYGSARWQTPGSMIICKYDGTTEISEKGFEPI